MLKAASEKGWLDGEKVMMETLLKALKEQEPISSSHILPKKQRESNKIIQERVELMDCNSFESPN